MIRPDETATTVRHDWIASLAFWCCLIVAAVLFAAVALGPKLVTSIELRKEYLDNQAKLVAMENRAQYLDKVADALESDPQFAAEVARIDFDAARPGDERIAVDKSLSLSAPHYEPPPTNISQELPWYAPYAKFLAGNSATRPLMAIVAAALVVVAFTFLHGNTASEKKAAR